MRTIAHAIFGKNMPSSMNPTFLASANLSQVIYVVLLYLYILSLIDTQMKHQYILAFSPHLGVQSQPSKR